METIIAKAWADIKGYFSEAEHEAVLFAAALVDSIFASGGALLVSAATDAVNAAEAAGGSNTDKFAAAFNAVKTDLESKGIPLVINAVSGAIEAAVANLRASETAATPDTTDSTEGGAA